MTITINYKQTATPGYTPRKPVILHNVASVHSNGIDRIKVRMEFTDLQPTHDHVASVSIKPEQE